MLTGDIYNITEMHFTLDVLFSLMLLNTIQE